MQPMAAMVEPSGDEPGAWGYTTGDEQYGGGYWPGMAARVEADEREAQARQAGGSPPSRREHAEFEIYWSPARPPEVVPRELLHRQTRLPDQALSILAPFPPSHLRWPDPDGPESDAEWGAVAEAVDAELRPWRELGIRYYERYHVVRDGTGMWSSAKAMTGLPVYRVAAPFFDTSRAMQTEEEAQRLLWESV